MLAITGGKGGCGKSTTALGLARELARHGVTPLVVDTDTDMPDLHHLAGVSREPSMDRLSETTPLSTVTQQSDRFPGVALLTAGSRELVDQALQTARKWQGPTIVDCPPGVGPGAIAPLRAASSALVVTGDQPTGLEDTQQTIRTLRQISTTAVGVLSISRARTRPQQAVAGCRVLETAPFSNAPLDDDQVRAAWQRLARKIGTHRAQHRPSGEHTKSSPDELARERPS
jgi:septum site-determining protein MinD